MFMYVCIMCLLGRYGHGLLSDLFYLNVKHTHICSREHINQTKLVNCLALTADLQYSFVFFVFFRHQAIQAI